MVADPISCISARRPRSWSIAPPGEELAGEVDYANHRRSKTEGQDCDAEEDDESWDDRFLGVASKPDATKTQCVLEEEPVMRGWPDEYRESTAKHQCPKGGNDDPWHGDSLEEFVGRRRIIVKQYSAHIREEEHKRVQQAECRRKVAALFEEDEVFKGGHRW